MSEINRNTDKSYTLYDADGLKVTLTFPVDPAAGFKVVTKEIKPGDLPPNSPYTWLFNFGIQNSAGHFLPSATYKLQGDGLPSGKKWYVYYGKAIHDMNGTHTSPGDPPVGFG